MRISVLGCGRWGSFLAWYNYNLGHDVLSYGTEGESFQSLKATRKNEYVEYDQRIEL